MSTHALTITSPEVPSKKTFLIGIAGGSASGKTSVSEMIIKQLDVPWVALLSMDSFYKVLNVQELEQAHSNSYNFDHPNALDFATLLSTLNRLKAGLSAEIPIYDFKTHSRLPNTKHAYGASVVIFEGIYGLYDDRIMDLMDLKIFVDTDDDIRLARRLTRDIKERGRDLHGVLKQYHTFVKPMFDKHVRQTMRNADVIIPRGSDNVVAVDLIVKYIARKLDEGVLSIRSMMASYGKDENHVLPDTVFTMPETPQLRYVHTQLRDRDTARDDFVFFADRLARMVVECALSRLTFTPKLITTPTGMPFHGLERTESICGVSIVRSGNTMERSLRKVCQDVPIGKILIQTHPKTLEPQLHYCKLPPDIHQRSVLLMDASIGTGAAAIMAIRILLDHSVKPDKIILMAMVGAPEGLCTVSKMFPAVQIVVSQVDKEGLDSNCYIQPGMGNYGDRYFGTEKE